MYPLKFNPILKSTIWGGEKIIPVSYTHLLITRQRTSLVMQTGVSAQQITKTQDKDASEVIRRVPGISIIEEKFVMVRGLSQRYNLSLIHICLPSAKAT